MAKVTVVNPPPQQAATPTKPAATEEEKEKEKSETLQRLEVEYKADPNKTLRVVNFHYARILTGRPKMIWPEFCDLKIKTFTDFWTAKKANPEAGKSIKITDADQLDKRKKELEKMHARAKAYEDAIKKAEAAGAGANKKKEK